MSFKILFYQEKGSFPVQEYIKGLDEDIELALVRKEMCEVWFKHGMIKTEENE